MRRRLARLQLILMLPAMLPAGCAMLGAQEDGADEAPCPPARDVAVYRRADGERVEQLGREVTRLQADLRRAEEALVAVESGLRGKHSRADAVSALAESRIQVKRAEREAPWREDEIREAEDKLAEADEQIRLGNSGAALFFVYRAQRIAELSLLEAQQVNGRSNTYFVDRVNVNLRAGPSTDERIVLVLNQGTPVFAERAERSWMLVRAVSGSVGWIHKNLLRN